MLDRMKITEGDDFIAKSLEHASIPTLLTALVHITGDLSVIRGSIRPGKARMGDYQGALSHQDQATARALALDALKRFRDDGCVLPTQPSPEALREMMSFLVGEPVPDEYVPMMLSEPPPPAGGQCGLRTSVIVVGAGMSGLLQAYRLKEAGAPFTIIEKADAVGGTWHENRYPGCRVDVGNHFYSYSFEPNSQWSEYFCRRDELAAYFQHFAERHGLLEHIRFGTEVVRAAFDEDRNKWKVTVRTRDGATETLESNVLVSAVGQLNRPQIPEIPGRDRFRGVQMHSATWDPSVSLEGKRVAVIGSGASAFQLVPEVAKIAGQLSVFQRSAPWMLPNPIYHDQVSEGAKWLMAHVPFYAKWYRFLLFWPATDGSLPSLKIDPDWPHADRSVNALNEQQRVYLLDYMKQQVGDDAELLAKITPTFPVMGKRILQDNGSWLRALKRENVELIAEAVTQIDEQGIVGTGRRYDVDVIVYATGFHANKFLWPMEIVGLGGRKLHDVWGDEPRAYLGITVPGFPNLFCLYGPATNLAHGGSIIFQAECQVRYVMGCIAALTATGASAMDVKREVYEDYTKRLVEELDSFVWSHPKADSWYRNKAGRVVNTSPWRLVDYWNWTLAPIVSEYELRLNA